DALESGALKAALQACNKHLKKQPNWELVKALKALTLARAGKAEESSTICDEILARKPTDDIVLSTLSHSLRTLGRHVEVTAMYDEAYKKQPGNEELGAQAFIANAKVSNWKAAQQVSTRMHKTFKDDRYLYWSIMAAVLQANDPHTPAPTRSMLFGLSLRLIETASTPSIATPDRFYLHLSILFELGRLAEADKLLSTEAGQRLCATSLVIDEVRSQVAVKRDRWIAERERRCSDRNWLTYLAFLDATFRAQSEFSLQVDVRTTEERVKGARDVLECLADQDAAEERGSLLALLELERRIRDESDLTSGSCAYVRLLSRYLKTFGSKPSCYEDLRPYVLSLTGADLAQWRAILDDVTSDISTDHNLRRVCNAYKLRRVTLTKEEISIESETEAVRELIKLYREALPLGKNLLKTDLQPADDLAVLAGEVFVSLWVLTEDTSYVSSAAVFLEYALTRSKHNYQFRLMLVRLYRLLAAPTPALEHYRTLNPKQMQTDTLSHLILSRAATFSLAAIGDLTMPNECLDSSQIYASNSTEVSVGSHVTSLSEMIARAFQHEKYSQVQDFILFEDRLDNSLQRDLTKMEHVRMRLTNEPAVPETIDVELLEFRFIFDRIHHDNRDFTVLPDHQPKGQSFDLQTVIGGVHPAFGWLEAWLKTYVRALSQASDYDENAKDRNVDTLYIKLIPKMEDPRPLQNRVSHVTEEELKEARQEEKAFCNYTSALAEWLEPHHAAVRPPKVVPPSSSKANGPPPAPAPVQNGSSDTVPSWQEPPEVVSKYFDDAVARLNAISNDPKRLPWEYLHVVQLAQEAFVLFHIQTLRFKSGSRRRADPWPVIQLPLALKSLRTSACASLKTISETLHKLGEREGSVEKRRSIISSAEKAIPGVDHDFALDIAKKITDARKRICDGVAKGIIKVSTTHS
ncbi:N-acetyltransferase B complex non catalytic subunit-domain-containing protein, partial [Hysterangium stoloniferum]